MDDLAMTIVMNDYLSHRDLRACKVVSRDWHQMASDAADLPRVRNGAAKTIQRAWRNCRPRTRRRYSKELLERYGAALGGGSTRWYEELIQTSPNEAFGGLSEVVFGGGRPRRMKFFGPGLPTEHTSGEGKGWVSLSPTAAIVTNIKAEWEGQKKAVPLQSLNTTVPNILDHPGAVIPVGLIYHPVYAWVPSGCELSWTSYHLQRPSEDKDGPINGLPGFDLDDWHLVPSDEERMLVSPNRILGRYSE